VVGDNPNHLVKVYGLPNFFRSMTTRLGGIGGSAVVRQVPVAQVLFLIP